MKKLCSLLLLMVLASCEAPPAQVEQPKQENGLAGYDYAADGWAAKSLPELGAALRNGEVTSVELVSAFIERIEAVDRNGPRLRSILSLNPNALEQARRLDRLRTDGGELGALHGLPILLKDNIESLDPMPTTAGALALKDNVTGRDAPLVAGLRAAGAVILGKTNLSQWANFRSANSMSGWSALGGQVRNPHMLDRNPCGSSSGSGAAMAASLAAGTVGTETNGSIICPSSVNGVVGFKPTVGLVSQQFIIPISFVQDTAGPMTKTVTGAAMMLGAMSGGATDYVAKLDASALQGRRIGVTRFTAPSDPDTKALFEAALQEVEAAGATLVDIQSFVTKPDFREQGLLALQYEFKAGLDDYLNDAAAAVTTRSLAHLIDFNVEHAARELALFDQSLFEDSARLGGLEEEDYVDARVAVNRAAREDGIDALLGQYELDALVSHSGIAAPQIDPIHGDVWPHRGGAGWLAAIAGYPHITVPMGEVHGLPVGLSFMAGKDQDELVLSLGFAYEQATLRRVDPRYVPTASHRAEIGAALEPYSTDKKDN